MALLSMFSQPKAEPSEFQKDSTKINPVAEEIINSANRLAFSLFNETLRTAHADSNVVICPVTTLEALAILYNGSSGQTTDEIGSVLNLHEPDLGNLKRELNKLITGLHDSDDNLGPFKLNSSLWYREGKELKSTFTEYLNELQCESFQVEFGTDSSKSRINQWLQTATDNRIKTIQTDLGSDIAAIFLSAARFDGIWAIPFDSNHTRDVAFHLSSGGETSCELMWLSREDITINLGTRHLITDPRYLLYNPYDYSPRDSEIALRKTTGVSIPYQGDRIYMTILTPQRDYSDTTATVDTLLEQLNLESWQLVLADFKPREFDLGLPKFRISLATNLTDDLKRIGIRAAFDPLYADFSKMFVDGVGWIDKFSHKTMLQVDENGTKAASLTEIHWPDSIPPSVIADRPFVIIIHDVTNGLILFIGRISNPGRLT